MQVPPSALKRQNPQGFGADTDDASETPRLERLVPPQEVPSWAAVEAPAPEQCLEVRQVPSFQQEKSSSLTPSSFLGVRALAP